MRRTIERLLVLSVTAGCVGAKEGGESNTDTAVEVTDTASESMQDGTWFAACPIEQREQRMIDVGEVRLNVACRGEGPTVVFLHGFPEFHYSWNPVMNELAEEYRLVAPDQRGYNTSDKPEELEAYELSHLAQDIINLLPLVSEDPVILVAHDWGGPVGWLVAHTPDSHVRGLLAANGPHPLRFAHLLETDPDQQSASSYMDFFRAEGSESLLTPAALGELFDGVLSEDDLAIYKEAWAQPGAIKGGLDWYRANSISVESVEAEMADLNPTIGFPVSVMWGLADAQVLGQNAEELEPYASDLVVETFEGVDHWIEHRIPEEVARGIRELDARAQGF